MSVELPSDQRQHDGCSAVSRPSKNNRQEGHEGLKSGIGEIEPSDLPDGMGNRPMSVTEGVSLRDEAAVVRTPDGYRIPPDLADPDDLEDGDVLARPSYAVLNEWRDWLQSPIYQAGHIEFENGNGEIGRTKVENSYMESYSSRYYARLKDLERGVRRRFGEDDVTTVMLTLSASSDNANGGKRCPADHLREIAEGWKTARKQLPHILGDREYVYARVLEPHESGYGHMHIALFICDPGGEVSADDFRPFMRSYTGNVPPAGTDAHSNTPCAYHDHGDGWDDARGDCEDCDSPVSVNDDVENVGSYISEYIGIFGDETLERPLTEQMFYATCWATRSRRLDFSNSAQEIISGEEFRRETGLRPEDRGESPGDRKDGEVAGEGDSSAVSFDAPNDEPDPADEWSVKALCAVPSRTPEYSDPVSGSESSTIIDGTDGVDPPKYVL